MSGLVDIVRFTVVATSSGLATYGGIELGDLANNSIPATLFLPEVTQGIIALTTGIAGNNIAKKLIGKRRKLSEQNAYSIAALNAFANTPNESRGISTGQSLEEISRKLVEVRVYVGKKMHTGSGLLITSDGYIITAYHVIDDMIEKGGILEVRRQGAPVREVDKKNVWYDKATDLAVIKIRSTSTLHAPSRIKVDLECNLRIGQEVRIFGFRDGQKYNTIGTITDTNVSTSLKGEVVNDLFLTDARTLPGFSGGVAANSDGALIGLAIYGRHEPGKEVGTVGAAKVSNILTFINQITAKQSAKLFKR